MKGLIIIPDITGFTNFVSSVHIDLGASIINDLLTEIIDSNPLDIHVSEIEGDAVLFYKMGRPIAMDEVFEGLNTIQEAFNDKLDSLKTIYNIEANLSLKFIVHYGEINVYNIRGFKKLYGQTVIEAHCLLKNGEGKSEYILITHDYAEAVHETTKIINNYSWKYNSTATKYLEGLRKIQYSFYRRAACKRLSKYVFS